MTQNNYDGDILQLRQGDASYGHSRRREEKGSEGNRREEKKIVEYTEEKRTRESSSIEKSKREGRGEKKRELTDVPVSAVDSSQSDEFAFFASISITNTGHDL